MSYQTINGVPQNQPQNLANTQNVGGQLRENNRIPSGTRLNRKTQPISENP